MSAPEDVIYLVAPTGHPNFGDEFIAGAWLRTLARRRPWSRVVLDCPNPGMVGVLHAGLHPRLTVTDTLFRLAEAVHADVPEGDGHWAGAARGGRDAVRLLATGMGLAPAGLYDEPMSRIWPRFDLIDVRDDDSLSIARAAVGAAPARVTRSGDDAWAVLGSGDLEDNGLGHGEGTPGSDRPIVLCLQGDLLADRDSAADDPADDSVADPAADPAGVLADAVIAALRGWEVDGRPVAGRDIAVVEAIPGVDVRVWERIAHRAPDLADGAHVVRFAELWDRGLPARAGQRWLTTRFHPHLIAAARGARGVALDVHVRGYYSVKHGSVVAAGSGWPVASLDDVAAAEPGPGMPESAVERRRAAKAGTVEAAYPLNPVVERMTASAVKARRAGLRMVRKVRRK